MGSLAGAAHLLNCNADAPRLTQREQKSLVDRKGKSQLDFGFHYDHKLRKHGLSILCTQKIWSEVTEKLPQG